MVNGALTGRLFDSPYSLNFSSGTLCLRFTGQFRCQVTDEIANAGALESGKGQRAAKVHGGDADAQPGEGRAAEEVDIARAIIGQSLARRRLDRDVGGRRQGEPRMPGQDARPLPAGQEWQPHLWRAVLADLSAQERAVTRPALRAQVLETLNKILAM